MSGNFHELMKQKNDSELNEYIANIKAYQEEIVRAAIVELENRGRVFTQEELCNFNYEIEQRKLSTGKNTIKVRSNLEKEIVLDPSVPELYSKLAIALFTILVNIFMGAVLTAMNFYRIKSKTGMVVSLLCGLVLQPLQMITLTMTQTRFSSLIIGIIASTIYTQLLWNLFIGKETKYRARSIIIPVIISIILVAYTAYTVYIIYTNGIN